MTFLEKLDLLMERDHLNRRALSRKAGIPYNTIDNWYKRGYEGLKLSTAGKLAEFFGTTTDFFLREELRDPDYGKTAGFQVDFPEMTFLQKRRALDDYGKQAVDAVLEAEYSRMPNVTEREQKGWITYISCYDLAVSAGTGEPLGDTYYTTKLEMPTAACGSTATAWSRPIRTGILCLSSGWRARTCGKGKSAFSPSTARGTSSSWDTGSCCLSTPNTPPSPLAPMTGWSVRAGFWASCKPRSRFIPSL